MSRGSRNESIVLRIILRAPTHAKAIAIETGLHRSSVNSIIGRLSTRKEIERIGTAADAGQFDAAGHTTIWARPGTPSLKATRRLARMADIRFAGRIEQRYRNYRWWAGV